MAPAFVGGLAGEADRPAGQFGQLTLSRINGAGDTCGSGTALRGLMIRY